MLTPFTTEDGWTVNVVTRPGWEFWIFWLNPVSILETPSTSKEVTMKELDG